MDIETEDLLRGRFTEDSKPSNPIKIVRIYLASNGSDSITERTSFIQHVYPPLREYCRQEYGVEFQVVDLAWNISEQECFPSSLKKREIGKCQTMSSGPSLIIFLGQKYGSRELPTLIPADEFESYKEVLTQSKSRDTRTVYLLEDWFVKDYNNLPPVYVYREPSDYFSGENSKTTLLSGQNIPKTVEEVKSEMLRLLEKARNMINEDISSKTPRFQVSLFEKSVDLALRKCKNPEDGCILITRNIIDLHNYVDEDITSNFVDLFYDENEEELRPCEESRLRLEEVELKARNVIPKENIISKDVLWRYNEVISPTLHHEYLSELCEDLKDLLKFQIDTMAPKIPTKSPKYSDLIDEVSRHWTKCYDVASRFYGRRDLVGKIHSYLQNSTDCCLLLHGSSGCGKTKLISKIATETNNLLGYHTITVVRFIGYSVTSSTARQLFYSITSQICLALGLEDSKIPDEITAVQKYLHDLISNFPAKENLVIYLDALEQLYSESDDIFSWLPEILPRNVKIIISSHSKSHHLPKLHEISSGQEITNLNLDECFVLLTHFLGRWNRTITSKQMMMAMYVFHKCSAPIFVKLLASELKNVASFDEIDILNLPIDIEDGMDVLLTNLEEKHGKTFVEKCLGSIVASKSGLSDCEITDILSLDETVVNEIYTGYQPPLRRVTPAHWLYLKESLEGFICSFDSDGVQVNTLKHDCLIQIITDRYLRRDNSKKLLHSVLADYFLGSWSDRYKRVEPDSSTSFPYKTAKRYVISQPLSFRSKGITRFNIRKYDQLPRHLKGAERFHEMNRIVFFNYDWLYCKMKALSLEHILEDFVLNPSEEASLVQEALRQAQPTIEANIDNLGPEIIGRLLPYYFDNDNIRALIKQCELNGISKSCFIPNLPYFNTPGSALKATISCPIVPECLTLINSDKLLVCKKREDCYVYVFDVASGKLKDRVFTSNGDLYATPDGELLVIFDHITEAAIKIHETSTGNFCGQIITTACIEDFDGGTIGEIKLSNHTLCTYISTKKSYSYLCIADLKSSKMDKIIKLEGKTTFCEISPDLSFVFCNSDDYIHCFDLKTYLENFKTQFAFRPRSIRISNDMTFLYACGSQQTSVVCMNLLDFGMIPVAKLNVDDETNGAPVEDFRISNDDSSVLVRSRNVILVYDSALFKLQCKFVRPDEIPNEFKLPKGQFHSMYFTDAQFSYDSRFVLGTIFRIVYIWSLDGSIATTISAPVGVISSLMVCKESKQFITHAERLPEIQVWDISSATKKAITTDRLTSTVKKIEVNLDNSLIFIQCYNSDELGIIDMKTGTMVDLLTHGKNIKDFAITPSGKYVLVTMDPRVSNSSVSIWDTKRRKIIREFGNTVVRCLPCHWNEMFYFIAQDVLAYDAPYYVHSVTVKNNCIQEQKHQRALKYLLDCPFITSNDSYLVTLSAESYKEDSAEYVNIALCIFCLDSDFKLMCHSPETIPGKHNIGSIVTVKPCPSLDNTIAIFYQPKESAYSTSGSQYTMQDIEIGICLFDIKSETITNVFDPLQCTINKSMISKQVFSDDFSLCLTDAGTLINLSSRREVRLRSFSDQRLLAVQNSVVIYYEGSQLYAYRISDKTIIGICEVHSKIVYLKLCSDDHTVLVGCADGAVTAYTVVNDQIDCLKEIISKIQSRRSNERNSTPDELSKSWDNFDKAHDVIFRRPPSARGQGPRDKIHLRQIEPAPQRPASAASTCSSYSVTQSRACNIM